jgi:hypothetical protein
LSPLMAATHATAAPIMRVTMAFSLVKFRVFCECRGY